MWIDAAPVVINQISTPLYQMFLHCHNFMEFLIQLLLKWNCKNTSAMNKLSFISLKFSTLNIKKKRPLSVVRKEKQIAHRWVEHSSSRRAETKKERNSDMMPGLYPSLYRKKVLAVKLNLYPIHRRKRIGHMCAQRKNWGGWRSALVMWNHRTEVAGL